MLARNYSAAIEAFKAAVDLSRKIDPVSVDVATFLNSLGEAERHVGDYDSAERDYNDALGIAISLDYKLGIAGYTGNLAVLALEREDWPRTEILATKALLLGEKLGNLEMLALNCKYLATSLVHQGRKEEGAPYARRAVVIYTRLGSPDIESAQEVLELCEE
jgi:tetratricopeptide (TPR) repeat protein